MAKPTEPVRALAKGNRYRLATNRAALVPDLVFATGTGRRYRVHRLLFESATGVIAVVEKLDGAYTGNHITAHLEATP